MKRKLSAIAILGLVLSGLSASPAQALTQVINCSISGTFTVTNNIVVSHSLCSGHASIPAGVTTIGPIDWTPQNAGFRGASNLTSITIPNSVTSIGEVAFYQSGLTSVTLPNSVTTIRRGAFLDSIRLVSISIPDSVTTIEDVAFSGLTSLASLTIPNSVTSIGHGTFAGATQMTSLTIPNSVTSIGREAFRNWTSLASLTIPGSVTSVGYGAFENAFALTSLTIGNSVTSIGESAFFNASALTSLTIPNSVTTIETGAFAGATSLTSLTIPNSVTSIGQSGFEGLSALTSLTIPNSVTTIGNRAFFNAFALTSLTIPSSVTSIGAEAFRNAGFNHTTFLGPAPTVGSNAFRDTGTQQPRALVSRAHIGSGAGMYGNVGSNWNGLIVEVPTSTLALTSEQAVTNQTFEFGAVPTDPQLTRAGFTLQGWSATQGGAAAFRADLSDFTMGPTASTLFAVWEASPATTSSEEVEEATVQFSGPLLRGVDKRVFDSNSASTMTLMGKRLHQITSATINGVKVEIQAKSRDSLTLAQPAMEPGRYTLILETRSGRLTLPKFVIVE